MRKGDDRTVQKSEKSESCTDSESRGENAHSEERILSYEIFRSDAGYLHETSAREIRDIERTANFTGEPSVKRTRERKQN